MSLNAPSTSNGSIEQIPRYEEDGITYLKRIGKGGYANVLLGKFRETPTEIFPARSSGLIAIKKFNNAISMDSSKEWREIDILKAHKENPRIVQIIGITKDILEDTKCSGYIMEYMQNGSLDRVIHDKSINYDLDQIYSWLYQAASGIMYLHEQNIIHRDIKPSNLLLGNTLDDLKVADFGLARHILGESSLTAGIGTHAYAAPEVFLIGKYNNAADVYSFTTTIWEIFHRKKPLNEFKDNIGEIIVKLPSKVIEGWHPTIESSCVEPHMKRLLERGWHKDPLQRITFKEIFDAVQPTVCHAIFEHYRFQIPVLVASNSNEMHLLNRDGTQKPFDEFKDKHELTTNVIDEWHPAISPPVNAHEFHREMLMKKVLCGFQAAQRQRQTILVLGGDNSNEMYLLEGRQWSTLSLKLLTPRTDGGAACLAGEIYIFGGLNRDKKTYKLNREMKWIQLVDMNEERKHISNSSVVFRGCIWVLGGSNKSGKELNSVEKYIAGENKWIQMPPMKEKRQYAAAAACKGKLFVSGGYNGDRTLRSMECFDPASKEWTMFLYLPSPAWGHAMISDGICLTVLGGWGEENSVWKINPNKDRAWNKLPQMRESRWNFTANLLGGNIFAIGGDGNERKVEFFNGETWKDGPELPEEINCMHSIVIPAYLTAALSSQQ